jgi:hypothetical protein
MLDDKSAVLAAEFRYGAVGEALAHGMRRQGWAVKEVDFRNYISDATSLPARIAGRLTWSFSVQAYNAAICRAVERYNATVFVTVKGLLVLPETLKFLRRRGVLLVNYYPDVHFRHMGLDGSILPMFDLFFTTKSFQMEHLGRVLPPERVEFLHHGYCDGVHRPYYAQLSEDDYVADLTYVGNHAAYKEAWLTSIVRRFPDLRLKVIGIRWETAANPALRKAAVGHTVDGDHYAQIIQRSKINLAVHSGPLAPEGWQDWVSTRTFEIPACKGFMLHVDNPEIRTVFDPQTEIALFDSEEDLAAKIEHYLANPGMRAEMIERAFARCVPAYGYDARAAVICDRIEALRITAPAPPR